MRNKRNKERKKERENERKTEEEGKYRKKEYISKLQFKLY